MSQFNKVLDLPMEAENAMTEAYVAVELGTGNNQVDLPASTAVQPFGIIQDSASAGESVPVRVLGTTKVVANSSFSKGDKLSIAATTGRVDTATALDSTWSGAGVHVIGVALEAASNAGDIREMLIRPLYYGT